MKGIQITTIILSLLLLNACAYKDEYDYRSYYYHQPTPFSDSSVYYPRAVHNRSGYDHEHYRLRAFR